MNEYYIHLSSKPNSDFKNNKFLDFSILLPFPIILDDSKWMIGISEVFYGIKRKDYPNMLICCETISSSIIENKNEQILRFIPENKGLFHKCYENIHYYEWLGDKVERIRIYIKVLDEEKESFIRDTLYCTLHLKKV